MRGSRPHDGRRRRRRQRRRAHRKRTRRAGHRCSSDKCPALFPSALLAGDQNSPSSCTRPQGRACAVCPLPLMTRPGEARRGSARVGCNPRERAGSRPRHEHEQQFTGPDQAERPSPHHQLLRWLLAAKLSIQPPARSSRRGVGPSRDGARSRTQAPACTLSRDAHTRVHKRWLRGPRGPSTPSRPRRPRWRARAPPWRASKATPCGKPCSCRRATVSGEQSGQKSGRRVEE
jgi:hypothetical protein